MSDGITTFIEEPAVNSAVGMNLISKRLGLPKLAELGEMEAVLIMADFVVLIVMPVSDFIDKKLPDLASITNDSLSLIEGGFLTC